MAAPDIRDTILKPAQRLSKTFGIRNKYNLCIFSFDPDCGNLKAIQKRIADRKTDIKLSRQDTVDECAIKEIEKVAHQLSVANRDMWKLINDLGFPT